MTLRASAIGFALSAIAGCLPFPGKLVLHHTAFILRNENALYDIIFCRYAAVDLSFLAFST